MSAQELLDQLQAQADPARAAQMTEYHKQKRTVLGLSNEVLNDLAKERRQSLDLEARVALADALWQADIFEARILAAKLLTQARLGDDAATWALLTSWLPDFDSWAIADAVASALSKRIVAAPARLDEVELWTGSDHLWTRRAALVATLPFAKKTNPKPLDTAARERILGWAAIYVEDRNWFIQKAVGWWVRDLSKHDPDLACSFLEEHGTRLKAFARKEAGKYLKR